MNLVDSKAVQLLKDLPEALLITTASGEIVFFNESAAKQSGFSEADMIGQHVSHLLPQSSRRKVDVVTWLERWANNPNPEQLRYLTLEGRRKNGDLRHYQVRVSRNNDEGEVLFVIVLRDVTEEQEQTASLRQSQLIANRIIAIGEDAVLSIDGAMNVCFWSENAERLFGYAEKEVLGKSINILLPESARSAHNDSIATFASGKTPSRMMGERGEIVGLHKSGRLIPLEASITKTYVGDQLILSAHVRDISAKKTSEAHLAERQARFSAVFDYALEAIALLDPDGQVLEINEAAKGLLSSNNVDTNQPLWQLPWWGGQEPEQQADAEARLKANVEEAARGHRVHTRTSLEADSGNLDLDFSLIPVLNSNDKVIYLIAEARKLADF